MATITSFKISNFKGAADVELDFTNKISTPILTMIGLNESGKTTILEALSYFVSGDNAVSSLFEGPAPSAVETLIPIHRQAAFTGKIEISAEVQISDEDVSEIAKRLATRDYELDVKTFPRELTVTQSYFFKDSVSTNQNNFWTLSFEAKQKGKRKAERFTDKLPDTARTPSDPPPYDPWLRVVMHLKERLPRIAYFPTFLVDLPKQIYLKEHPDEEPVNRYYRLVLQDVLTSLGEDLSLETHVCDRIEAFRVKEANINWLSSFFGGPTKVPIDAVFQKISAAVTREVLGSWENIFNRRIAAKSISVEWHIDTAKDNLPYATFSVSDGDAKYAIDQRSLGFRWFFSFLLFTTFKRKAKRSTIFIFDEPAANLHAKAQSELLKSFSRITVGENRIIYSTHSHHMINPRWLSGAYIVENTAIDHDADDAFGLTTRPTNIVATSYRQFVANYPTRTSYFQPVIEQLEFITPELLGSPPFLLVEGISDYYALQLVFKKWPNRSFALMPGCGAGASGPQISSMLGRGEEFVILLDDDRAGRQAAERYRAEWFLPPTSAFTLQAVSSKFIGRSLEGLLSSNTKATIATAIGKASPSKKEIGWFLAEASVNPNSGEVFDAETTSNFEEVLNFVQNRFAKA